MKNWLDKHSLHLEIKFILYVQGEVLGPWKVLKISLDPPKTKVDFPIEN